MEISKGMTIGEVLRQNRGTARIFMEFGMHCLGCPGAVGETVEQAAIKHGVELSVMLEKLNEVAE